jgi:hypothetical protein
MQAHFTNEKATIGFHDVISATTGRHALIRKLETYCGAVDSTRSIESAAQFVADALNGECANPWESLQRILREEVR